MVGGDNMGGSTERERESVRGLLNLSPGPEGRPIDVLGMRFLSDLQFADLSHLMLMCTPSVATFSVIKIRILPSEDLAGGLVYII